MTFLKKTHFFQKNAIFEKNTFSPFFIYSIPGFWYPRDPLAIVVTWVPITGVYNHFLGASGPIKKKTAKFCRFQILFFSRNSAKNHRNFFFRLGTHNIF